MESYNNLQEDLKEQMLRAVTNFKKDSKERRTAPYLKIRIKNWDKLWTSFSNNHTNLIAQFKKAELHKSAYFKDGVFNEMEELYTDHLIDLEEHLQKLVNISPSLTPQFEVSNTVSKSKVKLPAVKIPTFSGKYSEWHTFRDLFLGLVHRDESLDDAQKLYYLKGHLTGEAEQLLRNIQVTSDNYDLAWNKLDSTYNNKKFLAKEILNRLVNQKQLVNESALGIKNIINTTTDCLDSLKNLGVDIASWDILIIYLVSEKLDKDTRRAWELKITEESNDDLPTLSEFSKFLTGRFRGLEGIDSKPEGSKKPPKAMQTFHATQSPKNDCCNYCSASHKISTCKKLINESVENRRTFIREKGLCFICLKSNHSAKMCKNKFRCQKCKRRHHTLLHQEMDATEGENMNVSHAEVSSNTMTTEAKETAVQSAKSSKAQMISCHSTGDSRHTVLLATVLIKAQSSDRSYRVIRALLDQGSQGSFITESMVQYLGLAKIANKNTVFGVGGDAGVISKYTVTINIKSRKNPSICITVNAYVLKSVTALIPATKVAKVEWVDLTDDDLADPEYYRPNKIDILLGAEVYSQVINTGIKRNSSDTLLAQNTSLGWILSGVAEVQDTRISSHVNMAMHSSVQTDDLLKMFWELENEPFEHKHIRTDEEMKCEEIYKSTTKRDKDGRYIVRLPLRDADLIDKFGESRFIAEKRLKGLNVRLDRNISLKEDYTKVIHEYLQLNHLERVDNHDLNNKAAIYLPHHAVVREDRTTTKVRVVFDASCKGSNGLSLNDLLLVGPKLQADLRHIVMRWRLKPICFVADIVKMYRQVLVDKKDTMLQRILWKEDATEEIREYELLTVTFGTASAPYLAVRTLQQVAYDECQDDPIVAGMIINDFYMDDLMSGAETISEGFELYKKITTVLSKGGFKLQKWKTNSKGLIEMIQKRENIDQGEEFKIKLDDVTKILGLTWDSRADVFKYSVELVPIAAPITKRKIVSDISRLFDPLGWLAPCVVIAKVLIQKLWLAGVSWDEEVPETLLNEWITYRRDLPSLTSIQIPRWYSTSSNRMAIELHGFSDASKIAYAAVVYLRVVNKDGSIHVALVTSKTKVAPIKQVSIPRLELCGALLMVKLMKEVATVLKVDSENLRAWTDSEVVLAWLSSHPNRWKTFVANRVSEILNTLDTKYWSHVESKQNPADCASRGVAPAKLIDTDIWFNGPKFLHEPVIFYKKPKCLSTELETVKVHTGVFDHHFWDRYSSLTKLIRFVAYCKRFLNHKKGYLSTEELSEAMKVCIKRCQQEQFEEEIMELSSATPNSGAGGKKYKALNLFLDSEDIIRVGGRLEMSELNYDRKHPILIPKESFLTKLLITDAHFKTLHGGPQAMITYLKSRYWVVGVKLLVKAFYRKCVVCIRYACKTRNQLMGQLPSPRVTPNKVFLNTGVDYAGPINIRMSPGRGNKSYKGYIALFVCMSTRAIHLEAVSDMTSKSFLAAFKRFVSRRGHCAHLYSDNGTNFVGAARELAELFEEEKSRLIPEISKNLANNGTQWTFIAPHAPNQGGLWESGIKSAKHHLKRVVGNSTLTFEELTTVLAQIEACLNSRPLSYVEDQNELQVLTPGHFLVGEPLVIVPETNYDTSNASTLRRWQLYQKMTQDFWRRWSQDYLNQFLQRHKWTHQTPEAGVGDVVLIKEDDLPPGRWLLGRIENKHPGPDGLTRVVTIRTKASLVKRPTSKVCVLPVTD